MKRRTVLGATGTGVLATFAGCWGLAEAVDGDLSLFDDGDDGSTDGDEVTSEGNDDDPFDVPPEELLLSTGVLGDAWEQHSTDEENCREFSRAVSEGTNGRNFLTSCAWVYEDVSEAEEEYDSRVSRTHKLGRGSPTADPPEIGVEATAIDHPREPVVIFRDANAVGEVELQHTSDDPVASSTAIGADDAIQYATAMHEEWRE